MKILANVKRNGMSKKMLGKMNFPYPIGIV